MVTTLAPKLTPLEISGKNYLIADLSDLDFLKDSVGDWRKLPFCLKILLENLWRNLDHRTVHQADIEAIISAVSPNKTQQIEKEISFRPARVLMQDFTGVPAIVDLAAMRDAILDKGGDASKINPLIPVDLVVDHSVSVDSFATNTALLDNVEYEYKRNFERYAFLKWGTDAFSNFRVVPPGTGICHQVNLEYLAKVVWPSENKQGQTMLYPDTLLGTDSHTTMINGLSVLGWGVGGIEAEAAMLGQPISMLIPKVVGVHLKGVLPAGSTATDLVLTVTQVLRQKGVVGKFVEFFGEGLKSLSLADRATIGNMSPEYGATCGIFPIDEETLRYLRLTGRSEEQIQIVEAYAKKQCLWQDYNNPAVYNDTLTIHLDEIVPSVAGPKRPQDKVALSNLKEVANALVPITPLQDTIENHSLTHHDVVIAAITSCTNTSNPSVLVGAALLAKKANQLGLQVKPWVKTSFAPGSHVVADYLEKAGLMSDLEALGFHIVGFGCTTCIGNSGPLSKEITKTIEEKDLTVAAVLSGNRNFEGRINPHVKASYLASPPLVVAFALAGTTHIDLSSEPIGIDKNAKPVFLADIWPSSSEINAIIDAVVTPDIFQKGYASVFDGDHNWKDIQSPKSKTYAWDAQSTYVKNPPYFRAKDPDGMKEISVGNIKGARILALLGDSITTDHISPAGSIKEKGPAGQFLINKGISFGDFNSYGSRRGNHEIMMRGTFANIRLQNEMIPEHTGGLTRYFGATEQTMDPVSIYDAAMNYIQNDTPLVVIAGREYGSGSSRDWAAKGTRLLGVRAVVAESFERIHRSNLVGMGVLPLTFKDGVTRKTLGLTGEEIIDITGFDDAGVIVPGMDLQLYIHRKDGTLQTTPLTCRIDTEDEVAYMKAGGILPYVLDMLHRA
jgi:aconitate hydratase